MKSRSCCGALAIVLLAGCGTLSRGAFIDPPRETLRAGVLDLHWRRPIADVAALDWRPQFHGGPTFDPTLGRLYAGSVDNGLYALRANDGAVVWRFETLGRVESTPTVAGELVLFGSNDGALYAVEATRGTLRWRAATNAEVVRQAVATQDSAYFVNANDTVTAVSMRDGSQRWRYRRNPAGGISLSGHAGLARLGNRLYTGFSDGRVVCLDGTDGSVIWDQDTANDIENIEERNEAHEAIDVDTTPVVLGDAVFVASFSAGVYALDAAGGSRRWRLEALEQVASLATDGRYLYASSATSGLVKIDPFDGTILWARDLASRSIVGATPLEGGLLAVPTGDQAMWIVRSSDGEPVDGISPGRGFGSLPTAVGDRLFVESNTAVLYAFGLHSARSAAH